MNTCRKDAGVSAANIDTVFFTGTQHPTVSDQHRRS
jgi:hypothetical protein